MDVLTFFGGWLVVVAIAVLAPLAVILGLAAIPTFIVVLIARRLRLRANATLILVVLTLPLSVALVRSPAGHAVVERVWPEGADWMRFGEMGNQNELMPRSGAPRP